MGKAPILLNAAAVNNSQQIDCILTCVMLNQLP